MTVLSFGMAEVSRRSVARSMVIEMREIDQTLLSLIGASESYP